MYMVRLFLLEISLKCLVEKVQQENRQHGQSEHLVSGDRMEIRSHDDLVLLLKVNKAGACKQPLNRNFTNPRKPYLNSAVSQ
ncbi:MAG: hypothetical protein K0R82_2448 [Flavipsychrobacter sp.]|nr:hypothetical protein [Flavipsychrobacter sp.]